VHVHTSPLQSPLHTVNSEINSNKLGSQYQHYRGDRQWAHVISRQSPATETLAGERGRIESVRVDGMRFEMVGESKTFEMPGDETFRPNEKPLGGRKARPLTAGLG